MGVIAGVMIGLIVLLGVLAIGYFILFAQEFNH